MKKTVSLVCLLFFTLMGFSQDDIDEKIFSDFEAEKYEFIIKEYAADAEKYSSMANYCIGKSYFMMSDDSNAIKFLDLAIKKDKNNSEAHFARGVSLLFKKEYENSINSITNAIEIDSTVDYYYSGLGDSYFYSQKYDEALSVYLTALKKGDTSSYFNVAQVYAEKNETEKALQNFYKAKETMSAESPMYSNVVYNIGLYEQLKRNFKVSQTYFEELLEINPQDYKVQSKLIQAFYGQKEYAKAQVLKEGLYDAHGQGLLGKHMEVSFCFDQFYWNDKTIQVFERFDEKEGELYYKHLFFVVNRENDIEYTIQTENSPGVVKGDKPMWAIGMDRDNSHATYTFIEKDFNYDDLKSIVLSILNEEIEPAASSSFGVRSSEGKDEGKTWKKKKAKKKKSKKDKKDYK